MSNNPMGVILAGGQGARMGGLDKGLLEIKGRKLIEYTIAAIRPQVNSIIISANRNLGEYQKFTQNVVTDISAHYCGPLAGILSVMIDLDASFNKYSNDIDLLILPCDMPLLPSDLTARLYENREGTNKHQAVIVNDGVRLQPLCCLLPLSLKQPLKAFLDAGNRKVMDWLQTIDVLTADFSDEKSKFININTEEDLLMVTSMLNSNVKSGH